VKKDVAVEVAKAMVAHYGPMLGLDNWLVYVEYDKHLDRDVLAMVSPTEGRLSAVLTIGKSFRRLDYTGQLSAILHELLHCCHHRLTEQTRVVARAGIEDDSMYEMLFAGVRNEAEYMVDQLSLALVEYLPEP